MDHRSIEEPLDANRIAGILMALGGACDLGVLLGKAQDKLSDLAQAILEGKMADEIDPIRQEAGEQLAGLVQRINILANSFRLRIIPHAKDEEE